MSLKILIKIRHKTEIKTEENVRKFRFTKQTDEKCIQLNNNTISINDTCFTFDNVTDQADIGLEAVQIVQKFLKTTGVISENNKNEENLDEEVQETNLFELPEGQDFKNLTFLTYGQTGSGKTYTMGLSTDQFDPDGSELSENEDKNLIDTFGNVGNEKLTKSGSQSKTLNSHSETADFLSVEEETKRLEQMNVYEQKPDLVGICPKIIDFLCKPNESIKIHNIHLTIYEIYNDGIYDLLNGRNFVKLHNKSLTELSLPVTSQNITFKGQNALERFNFLIRDALSQRITKSTGVNDRSSRSHCIMNMKIFYTLNGSIAEQENLSKMNSSKMGGLRSKNITFIDLAGSERLYKSKITESMRKESISINTNLLCLGNVINALYTGKKFIPFRSSILTRILRPYFDNSFIFFIGCVSSHQSDMNESCYTLEYANRASNIRIKSVSQQIDNSFPTSYGGSTGLSQSSVSNEMKNELNRLQNENNFLKSEITKLKVELQSKSKMIEILKQRSTFNEQYCSPRQESKENVENLTNKRQANTVSQIHQNLSKLSNKMNVTGNTAQKSLKNLPQKGVQRKTIDRKATFKTNQTESKPTLQSNNVKKEVGQPKIQRESNSKQNLQSQQNEPSANKNDRKGPLTSEERKVLMTKSPFRKLFAPLMIQNEPPCTPVRKRKKQNGPGKTEQFKKVGKITFDLTKNTFFDKNEEKE